MLIFIFFFTGLAELYTALVWESTLLLAYCSEDLIPGECDFTKENIERLNVFFERVCLTMG